ncbi:MAG: S-methyl-5-thioribose-1-phosphate isomerase [Chloroflexi bacterium]|nr:S-methyl-5-thioribose-1-phosphate isomerase [Chloroflexota bacterium]
MKTVEWHDGTVKMIDQSRLPSEVVVLELHDYKEVADAIRTLKVRGAPAIGVTAAFALALAAVQSRAKSREELLSGLHEAAEFTKATRPTAVNLFWAIRRMMDKAESLEPLPAPAIVEALVEEAVKMAQEDEETNRSMGEFGASLISDGDTILTHCNAGALATVDFGTALGVIRAASEQGKRLKVFVDETRPVLQGARLTAWELQQLGLDPILITDNMAGHFMSRGMINLAIVGADRIAANGDVANKIGTYTVAVLAKENKIPFYVAAPFSTVDLSIATGEEIPIEERNPEEVTCIAGQRIAPEGVRVANPAFDVTPSGYVTAIITERGVVWPPFRDGLRQISGTCDYPTPTRTNEERQ